jgi:hypothetical protein
MLRANRYRNQLRLAPGMLKGFYSVFGCEPSHYQRLLAVGGRLYWATINALHVFSSMSTNTIQFHNKLSFCH